MATLKDVKNNKQINNVALNFLSFINKKTSVKIKGIKKYKEKFIVTGFIISKIFTFVLVSSNSGINGFLTTNKKKTDNTRVSIKKDFIRISFFLFKYLNRLLFESIEIIKMEIAGIAISWYFMNP